jgi:predicted amidohydrolase YtcJ
MFFILVLLSAASLMAQVADLVVENATIHTVDGKNPRARSLAVKDGKFLAVGADVRKHVGAGTKTLDARGATVIPGLIDSHVHMRGLGQMLNSFDFRKAKSPEEIAALVAAKAKTLPKGTWITGRNWDQANWGDKMPTSAPLDAAVPDHPVYLSRVDGHAAWVNQKAMAAAGLTAATKDPKGGAILHDASGAPTGVLVDRAMRLVSAKIPPASDADVEAALERAGRECARLGLTSVHDAGVTKQDLEAYRRLYAAGKMPVRVFAMIGGDGALWDEYLERGPEISDELTVRCIKLMVDGAMGSRGAAFWQPYSDEKTNSGLLMMAKDDIVRVVGEAVAKGFQVATHAIGDRANSFVLDAYATGLKGKNGRRFRVEHAQVIRLPDFQTFADLDVIASLQSTHATSDMRWAKDRLGPDRLMGAWAPQRFLKAGARIANGSDFPVEDPNPLWGIYAAITRQDHAGYPPEGFMPDQRLSPLRALESFTIDGAYAAFEEDKKGSITVGKLADFLLLDNDILTGPPQQIISTKVRSTVLGGKVVYEASAAKN